MSRSNVLSFVRKDVYAPLKERIQLGMSISECQLSKLYAYNGLMYTSGERFEIPGLLSKDRIVVIDNPKTVVNADVITVEDDGTDAPVRKYHRVCKAADVEVKEFDGEGLISKELVYDYSATLQGIANRISVTSKFLRQFIGRYPGLVFLDNCSSFCLGQMFLLLFDAFYDRIGVVGQICHGWIYVGFYRGRMKLFDIFSNY